MPRLMTIATTAREVVQNVSIPRGEALDLAVTPGGLDLSFTISDKPGGAPLVEIPGTQSALRIAPDHYEGLQEGVRYFCEVWDVSDPDDPRRLSAGSFTAANSILPSFVKFATQFLAGGGALVVLTRAEYDALPAKGDAVYVLTDTREIYARGALVAGVEVVTDTVVVSQLSKPVIAPLRAGDALADATTQGTYESGRAFSVVTTWRDAADAVLIGSDQPAAGVIVRPFDLLTFAGSGADLEFAGAAVTVAPAAQAAQGTLAAGDAAGSLTLRGASTPPSLTLTPGATPGTLNAQGSQL